MTDQNPDKHSEGSIERHLDPLDEEVRPSLLALNEKHDPTVREKITSHRSQFGSLIVPAKEFLAKLLQPFTNIILRRQAAFNAHLVQLLNKMVPHLTRELITFRKEGEHLYSEVGHLYSEVEHLYSETEYLRLKVTELRQENILSRQRLDHLLTEVAEKYDLPKEAVAKIVSVRETLWDHDYFLFENQFRGSQETIKKRQEVYVPLFKKASRVLDIGCGRGEFLEILREEKIPASGIDLNEDMIYICREKGLEVEKASVFPYLNSLADESLGGIFASHIIEHLETSSLMDFIKLCNRKLKKGAPIIFETPNPMSVVVSSTSFYLDISHVKPLHPQAVKFLLESCGFAETQIKYLSPFPEEIQLQPLPSTEEPSGLSKEEAQRLNQNVEKLNSLLYGFQDYAIMGKKLTTEDASRPIGHQS